MSWLAFTVVASAVFGVAVVVVALVRRAHAEPDRYAVGTIIERVARDGRRFDAELWPIGWPHEAPDRPFGVAQARIVMRQHRECDRGTCGRKRSAFATLVEARVIVPTERYY